MFIENPLWCFDMTFEMRIGGCSAVLERYREIQILDGGSDGCGYGMVLLKEIEVEKDCLKSCYFVINSSQSMMKNKKWKKKSFYKELILAI